MKQTIILLILSVFLVNCEEGGSDGGSSTNDTTCKLCGDYIPNEKVQLGDIAQYLVDNDPLFQDFYFGTNAGDGSKAYADSQIVSALKAYINIKTKTVDVMGEMDVLSESAFDAFYEATIIADGSSRGVSKQGLCYLTADAYESFRIDTEIVQVSGATHSLATDGTYCVVELKLPNGTMVVDPYLNRSFVRNGNPLNTTELLEAREDGSYWSVALSPDGFANAPAEWSPVNNYYHTFEGLYPNSQDQEDAAWELQDTTFDSLTRVQYTDIRM